MLVPMTTVHIRSGSARVLASGVVTAFSGGDLELSVVVDAQQFDLVLGFDTDPEIADVAIEVASIPRGLRLRCVNFDHPDGRGSAVPFALGGLGEDEALFVHFRVFLYGKTEDRTVHYTFYRAPRGAIDGG